MALITLTFRYRGIIDFERFYHEGLGFWQNITDPDDINEKKYKDKGNEFEGVWVVQHKLDPYFMATYEVDFKATDMSPTTITVDGEEKKVFDGKIRIYISGDLKEHYGQSTIAGSQELFKKDSWVHKLYKKLIKRDAEEDFEGVVIINAHEFLALVKRICNSEVQDG